MALYLAREPQSVAGLSSRSERDARLPLLPTPIASHPGKRYQYSYGLDVIGRVIEVVSGKTLDIFLKECLFVPLGMKDTSFTVGARAWLALG